MTESNVGGVRVERKVRPLATDDPMLTIMAELISLPQRIALKVTLDAVWSIAEAKRAQKECDFNSKMAQERADFYRAIHA